MLILLSIVLVFNPLPVFSLETTHYVRSKCAEELRIEAVIEEAYRKCFREYHIAGENVVLRIPFGQTGERNDADDFIQNIQFGGKGRPEEIWEEVDALLSSPLFTQYVSDLRKPGEKVIIFDIRNRTYSVSTDPRLFRRLENGTYPGTKVHVYVHKAKPGISPPDIYNYLYCVGSIGLDCSGFLYHIQKSIARRYGYNLDYVWSSAVKKPPKEVSRYVGLWFFDPAEGYTEVVEDVVHNLRPGDIVLFRGKNGRFRHSAVIQSIDYRNRTVRYLQSTDWSPERERGVHESFIHFDLSKRELRLKDPGVTWTQILAPTFAGEPELIYWKTDGDRYRSYEMFGGSFIVRLKIIQELITRTRPTYFVNIYEKQPTDR